MDGSIVCVCQEKTDPLAKKKMSHPVTEKIKSLGLKLSPMFNRSYPHYRGSEATDGMGLCAALRLPVQRRFHAVGGGAVRVEDL